MAGRDVTTYADFLLPHLTSETHLVDVGCGDGELSIGLAGLVRRVTAVDIDEGELQAAAGAAHELGVHNVAFHAASADALAMPDGCAEVVLAHSSLEAIESPAAALVEMTRVCRSGGLVAAASVEYDGLVLAGQHEDLLRRFYGIRERLWLVEGADPYLGRRLRGLFGAAGLIDVYATTTAISYGTPEAVREFGIGRADDCADEWYVASALEHGLASADDIEAMRQAWVDFSESPNAYASFTWCRAIGRKA